jgi:hypothetical protein
VLDGESGTARRAGKVGSDLSPKSGGGGVGGEVIPLALSVGVRLGVLGEQIRAQRRQPKTAEHHVDRMLPKLGVCGAGIESWTPIGPGAAAVAVVDEFLASLTHVERSPNTVDACARDLKARPWPRDVVVSAEGGGARCGRGSPPDRYPVSALAGFPSGQRGRAVNALALPSQVRILPPP